MPMFLLSRLYFKSFIIIHKLPLIYIFWYNLVHFNCVADFSGSGKNVIIYVIHFLILSLLSVFLLKVVSDNLASDSKQILDSTIL